MIASPQDTYFTPEEYLQMEENSPIKHEYINGYIYAMAGALDPHVTIAGNLFALLRNHVRGSGCRVYITDMKARIESLNRFYYPDVMVTCDQRDQETPGYKRFPCLIVEVLSNSTEGFDRGDAFGEEKNGQASTNNHVDPAINHGASKPARFSKPFLGDKFIDYQNIETLQEYVLINSKRQRIECFRRNNEGLWLFQFYTAEQNLFRLNSIDFEGTITAIYEDVTFESQT